MKIVSLHNEASAKTINHSEIFFGRKSGKEKSLRRCINNFFSRTLKETTFVTFRNVYHFHPSSHVHGGSSCRRCDGLLRFHSPSKLILSPGCLCRSHFFFRLPLSYKTIYRATLCMLLIIMYLRKKRQ